jgi:hypothetical protein
LNAERRRARYFSGSFAVMALANSWSTVSRQKKGIAIPKASVSLKLAVP